jgi:hypothetical protein
LRSWLLAVKAFGDFEVSGDLNVIAGGYAVTAVPIIHLF